MGRTLLCVLEFFLLNSLLYGYDEAGRRSVTLTAERTLIPAGGAVTLTCSVEDAAAAAAADLMYEWFRRTADSPAKRLLQDENDSNLDISQGGEYSCRGRSTEADFSTPESNAVTVQETVSNKATVIPRPDLPQMFSGERITLRCDIDGYEYSQWTYYWRKSSSNTLSANKQHIISSATESDSGDYRCMGRRDYSVTEWSNAIKVTVSSEKPKAELSADSRDIPVGGRVTLTCSVRSSGWKYFWYRRKKTSEPLTSQDAVFDSYGQISVSQGGLYWCRGGRGEPVYYTEDSDSVSIHETVSNKAVVTIEPTTPIFRGETVTVRCEIEEGGRTKWKYEWKPDKLNSPPTLSEYRIIRADDSDRGEYQCKGRRDSYYFTEWSDGIRLDVSEKPKAELSADSRDIPVGGRVTLTCSVRSSSGWKYFLYRGEKTSEPLTSQDAVFLSTGRIRVSQGGLYWCRGGRGEPVYYTEDSDSVIIHETVSNTAVVTIEPTTPIFRGETVTVRCEIEEGGRTKWKYEWKPDKLNSPPTLSEYRIIRADDSDRGEYQCKGRRDSYYFTEWSDGIRLDVSEKPKAELSADSRDIPVGGRVTLTCSVRSSSGWKYFWYRRNKTSEPLTSQDAVFLSTGRISVSQGGLYWCRGGRGEPVYYTEDSDSVHIKENVANRAVVTLQPNWSEIYRGETITLRCEIKDGGNTEWEYEWETTSKNKPLKQNEYGVSYASESDSGAYSCRGRMRSAQQSATEWSDPVTLTVSHKPKPVLTVSPSWLSPGDSVTLSCSVEPPSAGWRFFWYKAVPKPADRSYSYELLPDSTTGTEQDSYSVHGQTHTAGYVCRAARGDPGYHTDYSEPQFVWSGASRSSASLSVSPDRVQHFTSDFVSLSCEGNSTEWRVRSFTDYGYPLDCSYWGRMTGSTCNIRSSWYSDTGVYWCESGSGEFSNAVNITAQGRKVILASPVRPVTEGDSVRLSCSLRGQKTFSTVFFYRNDKLIQNDTRRELNISAVSKSDEGFYKCRHSGEESPQSWMSVREGSSPEGSALPVSLIAGLLCGIALVVIIILLLLFRCRPTKNFSFSRTIRSESTNQGSATGHMVDQHEAQHNEYSSPSSAANESQDVTYSMLELKSTGKNVRQHKPEESTIYSDVKVGTADDNLMYAQVNCLNTGKAKKHKGKSAPAATDDTVYSEVKAGRSLGL